MKKYPVYVKFVYNSHPDHTWYLGEISVIQSYKILENIRKLSVQPKENRNSCLYNLKATHNAFISFGIMHDVVRSDLELEPLYECSEYDIQLACSNKNFDSLDREILINTCYNCLRRGKCKDALMIETLGKVLFPKLYGKRK